MRTKRLDMVQIPYNPLRREAEEVLLPLAEELGLGVLVMSPLQGGILARRPTADQLQHLHVETWAEAILKWIASDPRVSTVLNATQRPGRPTENARAGAPPMFDAGQRQLVSRICAAG
jgi:aryl-alcohol dehydrogenase-like predicted oxidoreductase